MKLFHLNLSIYRHGIDSRQFTIAAGSAHEAIRSAMAKVEEHPENSFEIRCFSTSEGVVLEDSGKSVVSGIAPTFTFTPPPPPPPAIQPKRRATRKSKKK